MEGDRAKHSEEREVWEEEKKGWAVTNEAQRQREREQEELLKEERSACERLRGSLKSGYCVVLIVVIVVIVVVVVVVARTVYTRASRVMKRTYVKFTGHYHVVQSSSTRRRLSTQRHPRCRRR